MNFHADRPKVYELLTGQLETVLILNDRDQSLKFIWIVIIHWHHLDQMRCGEGPLELGNGQLGDFSYLNHLKTVL